MVSDQELILRRSGSAAVKEGCRIFAAVFLSLLLPLSFLLLARLSIARYLVSIITRRDKILIQYPAPKFPLLTSFFLYSKTTLILTLLVFLVTIAALTNCLTSRNAAFLISERRRLRAGWVLLFLMQICLSLGIFGTIDAETNSYAVAVGGSLDVFLPSRLFFAFGLHEIMVFWWLNVVTPVVDETIFGFSGGVFIGLMTEKVVLAAVFGSLWWRRLREDAEALMVLPWVTAELRMDVGVVGVLGWLLYYLTAAIGAVRVVKGFLWVVTWIFRYRLVKIDKSAADMDDPLIASNI